MADPQQLAALVAEFGKAYTRFIQAVMACETSTTPARGRLLAALQAGGACKMNALSSCLGVTPRNITKLADALEAEGLVARAAHPDDRRATLLHLTESGVHAAKEAMLAHSQAAASLYEGLSEDDREHFRRVLENLLDQLRRLDREHRS